LRSVSLQSSGGLIPSGGDRLQQGGEFAIIGEGLQKPKISVVSL